MVVIVDFVAVVDGIVEDVEAVEVEGVVAVVVADWIVVADLIAVVDTVVDYVVDLAAVRVAVVIAVQSVLNTGCEAGHYDVLDY